MGRMHIGAYGKVPGARLVAIADQDAKRASGDFSGGVGQHRRRRRDARHDGHHGHDRFSGPHPQPGRGRRGHLRADAGARSAGDCRTRGGQARALREAARARLGVRPSNRRRPPRAPRGFFMPAMCMRFWPQWTWLKQAVDERTLRARDGRDVPARRVDAAGLVLERSDVGRRPARSAHPRHGLRLSSLRHARRRLQPWLHARRAAGPITS